MSRLRKKASLLKHAGWVTTPRLYLDEGPNADYEAGPSTQTAIQRGEIELNDISSLPGRNGENHEWTEWTNPKDGQVHNYFGDYHETKWNNFLEDIKQNGILDPIAIDVEKDGSIKIYEGNHRVQAALQLGLQSVPVEIRYYGNSQRDVTQFGLGTGNYEYLKRGWQN